MKRLYVLIALLMFSHLALISQDQHLHVEAYPEKVQVTAGEEVDILVWLKVDKYYYTYAMHPQLSSEGVGPTATELYFRPEESFEPIAKFLAKDPKVKFDDGFKMDIKYYKKKSYFVVTLKAKKDIDFAKDSINIGFYAQLCDSANCYQPSEYGAIIASETATLPDDLKEKAIEYEVAYVDGYPVAKIKGGDTPNEEKIDEASDDSTDNDEEEEDSGLLAVIIRAIINGFVSIFMPCVFPMIPITVSFFAQRNKEGEKGKGMKDAFIYVFGIIGTFTAFGLLVSLFFGATGMQTLVSSPWFNFFVVGIFVVFGLSLLGAFEIQMPTSLTNKLDSKSRQGSGMISVLLMSATFSLASFSCTGPFIADALVASASGNWFYPMVAMLSFSAALSFPFFFLALFPAAMNKMPRAGAWMNSIKIVLGMIVIAMATKYLNTALLSYDAEMSRNMVLSIYASVGLMITLYILGVFKSKMDAPVQFLGYLRMIFAIAFATMTFYMVSGFSGGSLGFMESMLPARAEVTIQGTAGVSANAWLHNYDEALEKAKAEGKNVLVYFTGVGCTNCKKMAGDMFPRPAVQEAFGKLVIVKLYTDKRTDPESEKNKILQLETFKTVAQPTYIIITPDVEEIERMGYTGNENEFLEFLSKGAK